MKVINPKTNKIANCDKVQLEDMIASGWKIYDPDAEQAEKPADEKVEVKDKNKKP